MGYFRATLGRVRLPRHIHYVRVCWPSGMFVDGVRLMTSKTQLFHALSLRRWCAALLAVGATTAMVGVGLVAGTPVASAAQSTVGLGTATSFAVLAGSTVTNTGPSIITGDLGVSPGAAVTGFPPGLVNGVQHKADAVALQAQSDLTTGYNDAAGRTPPTAVSSDLGGQRLVAGVYKAAGPLGLTGTLTLDAQNDPNSVFIFQAGSTLITASNSTVNLVNGASPCNVFWQVGSSATLGTGTTVVGSILALTSASLKTGATVNGRILARNGAVTLDTNTITRPNCSTTSTTTTTAPPTTTTAPPTTTNGGPGGAGSGGPTTTTTPPITPTTPPTTTNRAPGGAVPVPGAPGSGGAGTAPGGAVPVPGAPGSGGAGNGGAPAPGGAVPVPGAPAPGNGAVPVGPGGAGTGTSAGPVIPLGHPETGAGGASHSGDNTLIGLGALALAGAGMAMIPDTRRRRLPSQGPGGRHQAGR